MTKLHFFFRNKNIYKKIIIFVAIIFAIMSTLLTNVPTKEIAEIYYRKACNLRATAEAFGVSRRTLSRRIAESKELAEALDSVKEGLLDDAESMLLMKMKEGSEASIMFFLKCQGKERGWIERQDINVNARQFEFNLGEMIGFEEVKTKAVEAPTEISPPLIEKEEEQK